MMKKTLILLFTTGLLLVGTTNGAFGQTAQNGCIEGKDKLGRDCGGAVQTAVPFLMINPDARSGAMGDVGLAISPDANAIHFNASKYAMTPQKFGMSLTYTPCLDRHP